MNPRLSVIVPVYNAEKTIESCIRSLQQQEIADLCEFIIVDDGSTDRSKELLETLIRDDARFRLIKQQNQGVSVARNTGLQAARGTYIGFVDADDEVAPQWFSTLLEIGMQDDLDVIVAQYEYEIGGMKKVVSYPFPHDRTLTQTEISKLVLPYFLEHDNMNAVWNKLYRRSLIADANLLFPRGMTLGEDRWFNLLFFSRAKSMYYIRTTGYYYKETQNSATRDRLRHNDFAKALEVYEQFLPNELIGRIDQEQVHFFRALRLIRSMMSCIYHLYISSEQLSFAKRYAQVNRMLQHETIRLVLRQYGTKCSQMMDKYERLLLYFIQRQSALGLYAAIQYSKIRNRLVFRI